MGAMSPRRIKAVTKRFQIFRALRQTNGDVTVSQLMQITNLPDANIRSHLKALNQKAKNARAKSSFVNRPDLTDVMAGKVKYENTIHVDTEN